MQVRRNGIYKTIDPSEFGIYQKAGFEKVLDGGKQGKEKEKVKEEKLPKLEPVKEEEIEELPELNAVEEEKTEKIQQQKPQQDNGKNKNKNKNNNNNN